MRDFAYDETKSNAKIGLDFGSEATAVGDGDSLCVPLPQRMSYEIGSHTFRGIPLHRLEISLYTETTPRQLNQRVWS